jgi:hypothetical protein
MGGLFLKNTSFYAFVRLPDDGRVRRPKHIVKHTENVMFIVLCYLDPTLDIKIKPKKIFLK